MSKRADFKYVNSSEEFFVQTFQEEVKRKTTKYVKSLKNNKMLLSSNKSLDRWDQLNSDITFF